MKKIFLSIGGNKATGTGGYDPSKGKFSTWSSTVCFSVLNREYQKRIRWESHMVGSDTVENQGDEKSIDASYNSSDMLAHDIVDVINLLTKENPNHGGLLYAIFGNPNRKDYVFPTKIKIAEAAREARMSSVRAKVFFQRIVRPLFEKRFGLSAAM
jgi:hypothetical protein